MQHVVADTNVFISFFMERNEKQRAAAKSLFGVPRTETSSPSSLSLLFLRLSMFSRPLTVCRRLRWPAF